MILKIIDNGIERVFYSADVIERISDIIHELEEVYPECGEYCKKIEETINENT